MLQFLKMLWRKILSGTIENSPIKELGSALNQPLTKKKEMKKSFWGAFHNTRGQIQQIWFHAFDFGIYNLSTSLINLQNWTHPSQKTRQTRIYVTLPMSEPLWCTAAPVMTCVLCCAEINARTY